MRKSVLIVILALIPVSFAHAQIPTIERDALIALYNSTDGANWSNNAGWLGAVGTECAWYGVACAAGHVETLTLHYGLKGVIPPELGNLSRLHTLDLSVNQLSGSIPPELGTLSNLNSLYLYMNALSGGIPAELGDLPSIVEVLLDSNKLSGEIPPELENLSTVADNWGFTIHYNALHTDDASLIAFLNSKCDGWQTWQTIAPENLTIGDLSDHTVWLSWDAVSYQSDPGGYEVFSAPTGSGVWTSGGWTESKTDTAYPVTWLDPATSYDFAVVTYTDPHFMNENLVTSDFSPEEMATTASTGCGQPIIEVAWGDPITLSVSGSYDSYLWSTGETTSTIDVTPPSDQWYWVTVTSAGPCGETGAVWVDPTAPVFLDGFESGDTTVWSSTAP